MTKTLVAYKVVASINGKEVGKGLLYKNKNGREHLYWLFDKDGKELPPGEYNLTPYGTTQIHVSTDNVM